MLRVTRETDYGILLLTSFVRFCDLSLLTTRQVAKETGVPYKMTCKILNILAKQGLLTSQRGLSGGYRLSREPETITLRDIVSALEGPIALTECSKEEDCACELEERCETRNYWKVINQAFRDSLSRITLSSLVKAGPANLLPYVTLADNGHH